MNGSFLSWLQPRSVRTPSPTKYTRQMGSISQRLSSLGIQLPEPKSPVANYLPCKRSGDLLFVSAKVSEQRGAVGSDVTLEDAQAAARNLCLLLLSIVQQQIGNLDHIESIDKLRGFIRSAPDFTRQPLVLDGASDVLVQIFADRGRHARTATATHQLPFGASVQLDMVLRLAPNTPTP